ncbi:vinorine synthase-like [Coffea eugenioides]|uniref:vinorine synthase-like n=1 Tax=Coffea eugenioides TaxID=49369 RepID=UPI000F61249D|nr:vinorine synthase-like [Coffea eugenioides]
MVGNIEVTSIELIKPSSPTPRASRDHKLSFLDQLSPSTLIPVLFYQNSSPCFDQAEISQHLKHSLSEILTKFYPLAGKINGNLSVDCDDLGALFIEARVRAHLSQAIQTTEDPNQFLPLEPYEALGKNDLPLAIKISFFECGGIAIGVCMSQKIADVLSCATFMNAWAATCRAKGDEIVQPDFKLGCRLFPPANSPISSIDFVSGEKKETLLTKRFVFDKKKLAALKKFASSVTSASSVKDPTLVEAVTAFILKHFILLTQAKENRKTNFLAFQAVNLRSRMNLPSDRLAFGNFPIATPALMAVSDTDDNDKEYCDDLVGHLRNATRIINNDYIKILQSGVPFLDILKAAGEQLGKEPMAYCFFTNLCSFPVYGVDYGFGKPISVRIKAPPIKNSVILMSTNSGDGIEAWITMVEDEMAMLPDELLSLATIDVSSFQAKLRSIFSMS